MFEIWEVFTHHIIDILVKLTNWMVRVKNGNEGGVGSALFDY